MSIDSNCIDAGRRKEVVLAASVFLVLVALLGFSRGSLGLAIFHSSVLAVAAVAYLQPMRSSVAFGLVAAGLGTLLTALHPQGQAYFLCQTAALVLMGFLPSLFNEDEMQRRELKALVLDREREELDALRAELAQVGVEMEREHKRAKAATQALKRLAA
jgi:hypothetical protein